MSITLKGAASTARDQVAQAGLSSSWANIALDLVELALPEDERSDLKSSIGDVVLGPVGMAVYDAAQDALGRVQTFQQRLVLLFNEATEKAIDTYKADPPPEWYALGAAWGDELDRVNLGDVASDVVDTYTKNIGIAVVVLGGLGLLYLGSQK